ncbi:MAG: hypothetical protein E7599_01155 [Ruminococcaceae bacterium]|nr:hypothetical protein [Oscillospiraceae bacterium]
MTDYVLYCEKKYAPFGRMNRMKNRNRTRSLLSLLVVLATLLSALCLVGCEKTEVLMSLDGTSIEEDAYKYWLANYKNYYISSFTEIGDDNESFLKKLDDGRTVGEAIEERVEASVKTMLCTLKLYEKYNLRLSSADKAAVKTMIEDNVFYLGGGDRAAFNSLLIDTYGFDIDRLEEILLLEKKVDVATEYLIEKGGIGYTADELDAFYMENYYRLKIIFVNLTAKTKVDENGKPVVDEITGKEESVPLTDEEKAAKATLADEILEKAKNGEDFDSLVTKYSEFTNKDSYPNGYYVTSLEFDLLADAGMPSEMLLQSLEAESGDVLMVKDDDVGIYIVKKLAPEKGAYGTGKVDAAQLANISVRLLESKFSDMVDTYWDKIIVDKERFDAITILAVKRGLSLGTSSAN